MIGSVTKTYPDDRTGTVTLNDDGTWSYEGDPSVVEFLALCVAALDVEYRGPSEGPYGWTLLRALAKLAKGTPHVEEKAPQPPGTIY